MTIPLAPIRRPHVFCNTKAPIQSPTADSSAPFLGPPAVAPLLSFPASVRGSPSDTSASIHSDQTSANTVADVDAAVQISKACIDSKARHPPSCPVIFKDDMHSNSVVRTYVRLSPLFSFSCFHSHLAFGDRKARRRDERGVSFRLNSLHLVFSPVLVSWAEKEREEGEEYPRLSAQQGVTHTRAM
ncbi:hypothetical protein K438DRAFT_534106 [Mycena galopus ATCC 62051]|nr:hypothetical protein K438DRAFT_534106 [Mycena galopus ATCC 62051]